MTHFDWDDDLFEIRGRDHSASLADGKQSLAGLNYRNQTVAQIVQQIADKFAFSTEITDPGVMAGPAINGENAFNPQPQSYWYLLQTMAESVGYECYMTPEQVLYFGPEKKQETVELNYGALRGSGAENPSWGLKITYNPRNNSNIVVKALSYDPQNTQPITATATAEAKTIRRRSGNHKPRRHKQVSGTARSSGARTPSKTVHYIRCSGAVTLRSYGEKYCETADRVGCEHRRAAIN